MEHGYQHVGQGIEVWHQQQDRTRLRLSSLEGLNPAYGIIADDTLLKTLKQPT